METFHLRPADADERPTIIPRVLHPWYKKSVMDRMESVIPRKRWLLKHVFFPRCRQQAVLAHHESRMQLLIRETLGVLNAQWIPWGGTIQDEGILHCFLRFFFVVNFLNLEEKDLSTMLLNKQWWDKYLPSCPDYWCESRRSTYFFARKNFPSAVGVDIRSLLRAVTSFAAEYGRDYLLLPSSDNKPCCSRFWEEDEEEEKALFSEE